MAAAVPTMIKRTKRRKARVFVVFFCWVFLAVSKGLVFGVGVSDSAAERSLPRPELESF